MVGKKISTKTYKKKKKSWWTFFFFFVIAAAVSLPLVYKFSPPTKTQTETVGRVAAILNSVSTITLARGSCPVPGPGLTGTYTSAQYSCIDGYSAAYYPGSCTTAQNLALKAEGICYSRNSAVVPSSPPSVSITRIPSPAGTSYSCSPNSYIAGTYCSGSTSCYDIYCNASGSGTRDASYGSSSCSFCGSYRCSPNTFIAGTYYDPSYGRKYDVYCNTYGTATQKRYY